MPSGKGHSPSRGSSFHRALLALAASSLFTGCINDKIPLPGGEFWLVVSELNGVENNSSTEGSSEENNSLDTASTQSSSDQGSSTGENETEGSSTTGSPSSSESTQSTGGTDSGNQAMQLSDNTDKSDGVKLVEDEAGNQQEIDLHVAIRIQLDKNTLELVHNNAVVQTIPFKRRSRVNWHTACPKQLSAERIEVVDLQIPQLEFAGATIRNPVLMADCFMGGMLDSVFLRSKDTIPELSTSCDDHEQCLQFGRARRGALGF